MHKVCVSVVCWFCDIEASYQIRLSCAYAVSKLLYVGGTNKVLEVILKAKDWLRSCDLV